MSSEGLDAVELRTILIACILFAVVLCCVIQTEPPDIDDDIEHMDSDGREGAMDPKKRALVVHEHLESHEFTVEDYYSSDSSLRATEDNIETGDNDKHCSKGKTQVSDDDEEHVKKTHDDQNCTSTRPTIASKENDEEDKGEQCAICMEKFIEGVAVSEGLCRHQFHYSCISSWLCKNTGCPMCREIFLIIDLPNTPNKESEQSTHSTARTSDIESGESGLDQMQYQEEIIPALDSTILSGIEVGMASCIDPIHTTTRITSNNESCVNTIEGPVQEEP